MADKYKLYLICPSCSGTGIVRWRASDTTPGGTNVCPTCEDDPENPLGAMVFDGMRHVYEGRFEEVQDPEP